MSRVARVFALLLVACAACPASAQEVDAASHDGTGSAGSLRLLRR